MALTIIYNGEKYPAMAERILSTEAMEVERLTGWTWLEALNQGSKGSVLAQNAIAFVSVKRFLPDLRFSDFSYVLEDMQDDETDGGIPPDPTDPGDEENISAT